MAAKHRWRSFLPDPFWPTLAALLMLSVLTAVPFYAICALVWPNVRGSGATLIGVACYVAAVPLTWWLFRVRKSGR